MLSAAAFIARRWTLTLIVLPLPGAAAELNPLLTGEVYSRQAQEIIVPLTTNWQASISVLVPEGSFVEKGDVVAEFDGTDAARQFEQQLETARTELARTERDLARLRKELAQADYQLQQDLVTLELTSMKAEVPADLIGALEHAENQLAREQATKAVEDSRKALANKRRELAGREEQAEIDARKSQLSQQWWTQMLESFVIKAVQPGYVIYGNHPWTRAKFQEGDNVQTSFHIAQVADTSDLAVKVWINGVDKPYVKSGTRVRIIMDALPDRVLHGRLVSISDSAAKRQEWGTGVYFEGIVDIEGDSPDSLMPGMSVLVEAGS